MIPSLVLLSASAALSTAVNTHECFSCSSNPDWQFYMNHIKGLKNLAESERPPLAPLSCIFDPFRIYADRTAVNCDGKCMKWMIATIQQDGGVEVSMLRGCFAKLVDTSVQSEPVDDRCYQSPADYNHQVGVDYSTTCFCGGFICNSAHYVVSLPFLLCLLLISHIIILYSSD